MNLSIAGEVLAVVTLTPSGVEAVEVVIVVVTVEAIVVVAEATVAATVIVIVISEPKQTL